jgi:hypothetical protein
MDLKIFNSQQKCHATVIEIDEELYREARQHNPYGAQEMVHLRNLTGLLKPLKMSEYISKSQRWYFAQVHI